MEQAHYNSFPPQTTEEEFGSIETDKFAYQPLDRVRVSIQGRAKNDTECRIKVCDANQRAYFEKYCILKKNRCELSFTAAGPLGAHYIYLFWPDGLKHSRYRNFILDADTGVETGDADYDELYPRTYSLMQLGRREYETQRGKFVGYISADTCHFDGIWLRDWIYSLPAYRHWEREMKCGLERFLESQNSSGMIPDGIERDGRTWRVGMESDVEYILVLGVWQTWQAAGDHAWLSKTMPKLERALDYIRGNAKSWDSKHKLIKRQHSCDTWDFDIDGAPDTGEKRHVIATCDQSGYSLAFAAMANMYEALNQQEKAAQWIDTAANYRERANKLLWDGVKFQHHIHIDEIDHGDFDEKSQLAMGNTWAMTRGLAEPDQARSIIEEYRRRHAATGDAYPWWSLQPGYPDNLGYFAKPFLIQGGYANGGLMPWVGGELCRAAFFYGRENYGIELLKQYMKHLRGTKGAHVWYWPNGKPGFRTNNEVPYAGWGLAQWMDALMSGLAGICEKSCLYESVHVSPKWAATRIETARATARYAASTGYFAYRMRISETTDEIQIEYSGSGKSADFEVLLPSDCDVKSVSLNNHRIPFSLELHDKSLYAKFRASIIGHGMIRISLKPPPD